MTKIRSLEDLAEDTEYTECDKRQFWQLRTGESPRGYVRAWTGSGGLLKELRIDPTALRLSADELAAEVIAAVTAAQGYGTERPDDIMAPLLGMRPGEQALAELEEGMTKLDSLAADLDRIARRGGLAR